MNRAWTTSGPKLLLAPTRTRCLTGIADYHNGVIDDCQQKQTQDSPFRSETNHLDDLGDEGERQPVDRQSFPAFVSLIHLPATDRRHNVGDQVDKDANEGNEEDSGKPRSGDGAGA